MKRESILVLAIVFLLAASASVSAYSGGDGSAENPYRIATPNDLNDIGNHPEDFNDCFILVNDINMANLAYTTALIAPDTDNTPWEPFYEGTGFTGVFDGNGHRIMNLTIDTLADSDASNDDNDYLALFGAIWGDGQVINLGMENVSITGGNDSYDYSSWYIGAFCGRNSGGITFNCYATGNIQGGRYVGGLCGWNTGYTISDCFSTVNIQGNSTIGGLCGDNMFTISNCYATGNIQGNGGLGGLCGMNTGTISNCYATGSVTGGDYIGGLCGFNADTISNCYATGSVTGGDYIGGLCGYNWGYYRVPTMSNCYSTGRVTGGEGSSYIGGLVGWEDLSFYTSCFWDSDINPDVNGIGNATDPNVISKSTTEMKKESTFTDYGWDFVETWDIGENQTYPYLRIYPAGDLNHDGLVDFFDIAIVASHWLEGTEP